MASAVLFDRHDVERCDRDATIVIEPHYDSTAPRVNTGMIWAGDRVAVSSARDDGKRFKRRGRKVRSNVPDHAKATIPRQSGKTPRFYRLTLTSPMPVAATFVPR